MLARRQLNIGAMPARRMNVGTLGQDTRYVFLGDGTSPPPPDPNQWVKTKTRKGDTLASLATYYNKPAKEIVQKNGAPFTNDGINQWVSSIGGQCLAKVAGQPIVKGCSSSGWAVFTDNTEIMLPNIPRAGVNPAPGLPGSVTPPLVMGKTDSGMGTMLGILAAGTLGIILWHKVKTRRAGEKKKKSSPASVSLPAFA